MTEVAWKPLRPIPVQDGYKRSRTRFNVTSSGRRSGKTEIAKRRAILKACRAWDAPPNSRVVFGAPTRPQAKEIYWEEVKQMTPPAMIAGDPRESDLTIVLVNGVKLAVMGMERPKRVEGSPLLHIVLDEYGNMRPEAWVHHVRPALADTQGTADFIGKPVGRNHYYDLVKKAQSDDTGEWAHHTWKSAEVLPPEEVEAARRDMDELSFRQEFEADFVDFEGQAYYAFSEEGNVEKGLVWDKDRPLALCFDFNISPGVAVVCQEDEMRGLTKVLGEVWIPKNSNTPKVCRRLARDWGEHRGPVLIYGDATGGAGGSAKVDGSDWELVKRELGPVFGNRIRWRVPRSNPPERARVNALNSRLTSGDGQHRIKIDPTKAPHLIRDLEGVRLVEGGSGEIDKKHDKMLTHQSDALGYRVIYDFPVGGKAKMTVQEWY